MENHDSAGKESAENKEKLKTLTERPKLIPRAGILSAKFQLKKPAS